jgi:hypothetical protein
VFGKGKGYLIYEMNMRVTSIVKTHFAKIVISGQALILLMSMKRERFLLEKLGILPTTTGLIG